MAKTRAERLRKVIEDVGGQHDFGERFLARRVAGRLLEEAVELALAHGLTIAGVHGHIADAIHNECRKEECFPSEFGERFESRPERIGEMADVQCILEYLALCTDVSMPEIGATAETKVLLVEQRAANGEMHVINGLLYKKAARG